jgi:hypothetical protein
VALKALAAFAIEITIIQSAHTKFQATSFLAYFPYLEKIKRGL